MHLPLSLAGSFVFCPLLSSPLLSYPQIVMRLGTSRRDSTVGCHTHARPPRLIGVCFTSPLDHVYVMEMTGCVCVMEMIDVCGVCVQVGLTLPHISNQMPLPIPSISGLGSVGADQDITIKLQVAAAPLVGETNASPINHTDHIIHVIFFSKIQFTRMADSKRTQAPFFFSLRTAHLPRHGRRRKARCDAHDIQAEPCCCGIGRRAYELRQRTGSLA